VSNLLQKLWINPYAVPGDIDLRAHGALSHIRLRGSAEFFHRLAASAIARQTATDSGYQQQRPAPTSNNHSLQRSSGLFNTLYGGPSSETTHFRLSPEDEILFLLTSLSFDSSFV
jgi:hypothetical protein